MYLYNPSQVAVGSQLQPLFLGPHLDASESSLESRAPEATAHLQARLQHQLVKQPHVDEVEELREELDGQRRVHTATPQHGHRRRQRLQDVGQHWPLSTVTHAV